MRLKKQIDQEVKKKFNPEPKTKETAIHLEEVLEVSVQHLSNVVMKDEKRFILPPAPFSR